MLRKNSREHDVKMSFSNSGSAQRLTGSFKQNGTHGMLKASNLDFVDNVSPVFGGLVDSICGLTKPGEITSAITKHVDIVKYSFKQHKSLKWCDASKYHLQTRIQTFEKHAKAVFGMYQTSEMLTQKWQALDHLCEGVTYAGCVESLHAGVYEASHKQFEAMYAQSSRIKRSGIDKVVVMLNSNDSEPPNMFLILVVQKDESPGVLRKLGRWIRLFLLGSVQNVYRLRSRQ